MKLPQGHHWILKEKRNPGRSRRGSRTYECKRCKQGFIHINGHDIVADYLRPCEEAMVHEIMSS